MNVNSFWSQNYELEGCALTASSDNQYTYITASPGGNPNSKDGSSLLLSKEQVYALRDVLVRAVRDLEDSGKWPKQKVNR